MGEKHILICLEKLDIGGVETAVVNQATTWLQLGYQVVILSKKGIYTEVLEKKGAICIEFDFALEENYHLEKAKVIQEIIQTYTIDEVHINQFPCILSAVPACIVSNTPYVAYAHNTIGGVYEWFMATFPVYQQAIPFFYHQAYHIVAITDKNKQELIQRFEIPEEKITVIHNSINFEEVDSIYTQTKNEKKQFLLISRLSQEKLQSILNGLEVFCCYANLEKEARLSIIGSGELENEIRQYVINHQIEDKVTFLGAKNEVLEFINKADIVIGVDRCILETIAMKKIAVITGYENLKQIVTPENIVTASSQNFSGNNLETKQVTEIVEELFALTQDEIVELVEQNYQFVKQQLNIKHNFYVTPKQIAIQDPIEQKLFEYIIELQQQLTKQLQHNIQLEQTLEKEQTQHQFEQRTIQMNEKTIQTNQERIQALEQELQQVYESKRWRYTDKISKIFH